MMLLCLASMGFLLVWLSGLAANNRSDTHSPPPESRCPHCHQPINSGQSFCPSCHARLGESGQGAQHE